MALNSARLDVHLISRLLGHSSVTVTEKVYATFLLPTLSSEVREKLSFSEFGLSNP
jgi:integrase